VRGHAGHEPATPEAQSRAQLAWVLVISAETPLSRRRQLWRPRPPVPVRREGRWPMEGSPYWGGSR
jgi:hypothetical protein